MAAAQALGTDGNERGCTNSWEAALEVVQLGEDRHQGESRGPTGETKVGWVTGQPGSPPKSPGNQATPPRLRGSASRFQLGLRLRFDPSEF